MAAVSGGMAALGLPYTYMPSLPVRIPDDNIAYSRSQLEAPLTALVGVVADGRQPEKLRELSRYRVRKVVGQTNRWRLPESLGSDLLGSSQAIRAIRLSYNRNMRNIITAENPRTTVNLDMDEPYSFRRDSDRSRKSTDRPRTTTGQEVVTQRLVTPSHPQLPSTARLRRSLTLTNSSSSLPPIKPFIPASARPPKPLDVFHYHARRMPKNGPDVLLQCLDTNWELHCPLLVKSKTLSSLLLTAGQPSLKKYYKTPVSRTLDEFISSSNIYSTEYQQLASRGPPPEEVDIPQASEVEHPKHFSDPWVNNLVVIKLDVDDPSLTPHAMAVALGNLYHDDTEVDVRDLSAVLAAAHVLQFEKLQKGCVKNMLQNIQSGTVCKFFTVAARYKEENLKTACVTWLELNLVPQLSLQIQLRQMTADMLVQVLKSDRLFTYSEFSLYRVLAYWVFMQLNPQLQLMPSYNTILAFFNSLPKTSSLLEREVGRQFLPLFNVLRLHGITDTRHLQDIQTMNILPQSWIVKILSKHYQALQSGGDMVVMKDFNSAAIRHGFLIDDEPHYHSEIISMFGFHYELKVMKLEKKGAYKFHVQRLKPSDPVLSFRQCERHTFSMRPGRETKYNIRIQYFNERHHYKVADTGPITQRFSLADKTNMSEDSNFENLTAPMYVTFSLLFPPS